MAEVSEDEKIRRAMAELDGDFSRNDKAPHLSEEERRINDLQDKKLRGEENVTKIMEAEAAWVQRHKELLGRFKERMTSQGDMESFISDQIVDKLDVVALLDKRIDEKKDHMSKLKYSFSTKVESNSNEHKKVLRVLHEEKRALEDKLDFEQQTQQNRDNISVDYVVFQRRLTEDKASFRAAIQEFESASIRDMDRLIRKEMIRNQGAKGAYKEQLLAEKRKSGAKATQDYVANLARIKEKGAHTMTVLADNELLMKQQHGLKHALEVQRLAAERAQKCNEELERHLKIIVKQYFENEEVINQAKLETGMVHSHRDQEMEEIKMRIAEGKSEAEQLRKALRSTLEESETYKEDVRVARQEAHDMFSGDSVAWAITAALPAIRSQPEDDANEATRMMETDEERNENDLELLLSALHLSSRRDDAVVGSRGGHGSRGGFGTPRVEQNSRGGRTPRLHTRGSNMSHGSGSRRLTPRTPRVF